MRTYWIVLVTVALLVGFGIYQLIKWPGFQLANVDVHGARVTPVHDILVSAALRRRSNMWLMNLSAARARIEALPYVKTATLIRVPPHSIDIAIVERVPEGCVEGTDGVTALIDKDRRVLTAVCPSNVPVYRLPDVMPPAPGQFIRDAGLVRLQADAQTLQSSGTKFVALRHDEFAQLDATMPDGVTVLFGDETDLPAKVRLIDPILKTASARLGPIRAIDLREPGTPVVRYRGNDSSQKPPG